MQERDRMATLPGLLGLEELHGKAAFPRFLPSPPPLRAAVVRSYPHLCFLSDAQFTGVYSVAAVRIHIGVVCIGAYEYVAGIGIGLAG